MDRPAPTGAYGFALVRPDGTVLPDLAAVDPGAPEVVVDWTLGSAAADLPEQADEAGYRSAYAGGAAVEVRRSPGSILCTLPEPTSAEAFVHPILTFPLSLLAAWRGDLVLHGGAFVAGGRAWIVTGAREAGKSSLLATLAGRGVPILADDLAVVSAGHVLAGPSCVDLRPDTAARFAGARSMGVVAGRERHRLATPAAAARVPVGGLVVLGWSEDDTAGLAPLSAPERLAVLHREHYAGRSAVPSADAMLDGLGLAMWRLWRPRDWAATTATVDRLLQLAEAPARASQAA